MLGWEFPPVISGGLGTACKGLTKALSAEGTDILFVLPRSPEIPYESDVEWIGLPGLSSGKESELQVPLGGARFGAVSQEPDGTARVFSSA